MFIWQHLTRSPCILTARAASAGALGKRTLEAMREVELGGGASNSMASSAGPRAAAARGPGVDSDRPTPFLEKLPLLGGGKRPKKKRLSWADGQSSGKVRPRHKEWGSESSLRVVRGR